MLVFLSDVLAKPGRQAVHVSFSLLFRSPRSNTPTRPFPLIFLLGSFWVTNICYVFHSCCVVWDQNHLREVHSGDVAALESNIHKLLSDINPAEPRMKYVFTKFPLMFLSQSLK